MRRVSPRVLLIRDVLEPGHHVSASVSFLDRDMCHETVGRRAVPVLLTRLDVDDVAGADLRTPPLRVATKPIPSVT